MSIFKDLMRSVTELDLAMEEFLNKIPNPQPITQAELAKVEIGGLLPDGSNELLYTPPTWAEPLKVDHSVYRGRLSSADPIARARACEDQEFRDEVTKKLQEVYGGEISQHTYAEMHGDETTVKIELKCECGADTVQAAYHSAWCPKGTK